MNIPDYLSIRDYNKLKDVDMTSNAGLIEAIKLIINTSDDELKAMSPEELHSISKEIKKISLDTKPKFWPVFQFGEGVYGFQPLSKMTLGEWIDLDTYLNDWQDNLHNIMAVCYRPITKYTWKNPIFKAIHNIKVWFNEEGNSPFDTYEIEDYDTDKAKIRSELFLDMPMEIANGALAFFLAIGLQSINDTTTSSGEIPTIEAMMATVESVYHPIMAG